jgi:hypothetical protein
MKAIVFVGPTISPQEVSEVMDAVCLPPAAQGDVYRASLQWPSAIGIIDGYFERVPAVWHKEILWAMSQGIHVFGSASMGALRAAELAAFGMTGVGAIFEAYRDGVLEDDDEVAVAHALAEDGYRTGSDAMVNIRSTLARAQADGILDAAVASLLQQIAKDLFYPERSYARILELAAAEDAPLVQLEAFRHWLPQGAVNQKREDALLMLRSMRDFLESNPEPKRVSWTLEETDHWEVLKRWSGEMQLDPSGGPDSLVLNELRRDPQALARASNAALGWWLASESARREGQTVDAGTLLDHSAEFCQAHSLSDASDVAAWLERNHCGHERLERIVALQALARRAHALAPSSLEACLLDYLRWTGDYTVLLSRVLPSRARQ